MKRAARLNALPVFLDPAATTPLWLQLSISLRMAIANGRLSPGGRLPSTRQLARQLNVSRNTVMATYESVGPRMPMTMARVSRTLAVGSKVVPEDVSVPRLKGTSCWLIGPQSKIPPYDAVSRHLFGLAAEDVSLILDAAFPLRAAEPARPLVQIQAAARVVRDHPSRRRFSPECPYRDCVECSALACVTSPRR